MSEAHSKPWHPYEGLVVIREYEDTPLDPYGNVPVDIKKNTLEIARIASNAEAKVSSQATNTGTAEDAECDGIGVDFNVPDFENRAGTIRVHLDFLTSQLTEQTSSVERDIYFIYPNGVGILNKTVFSYGDERPSSYTIREQRFVTRGEIPVLGTVLSILAP